MLNTSKPGSGWSSAAALLLALSSLASCKGTARSLEASGEAGTSSPSAASSEAPDAEIPYLDIRCDPERGLGFCAEPHRIPGKAGAPVLEYVMPSRVFLRTLTVDEEGCVWVHTTLFLRDPRITTDLVGRMQPASMRRIRELVEDAVRGPVISADEPMRVLSESAPPTYYLHIGGTKYVLYENHYHHPLVTTHQRRRPSALALRRLIDDVDRLALKVPPPASSHGTPGKEPR